MEIRTASANRISSASLILEENLQSELGAPISVRIGDDAELGVGQIRHRVRPGLLVEQVEHLEPQICLYALPNWNAFGNRDVRAESTERTRFPIQPRRIPKRIERRIGPPLEYRQIVEVVH